jgi:hypothetical protein
MCGRCRLAVPAGQSHCGRCGTAIDDGSGVGWSMLFDWVILPLLMLSAFALFSIVDLLKRHALMGIFALMAWAFAASGAVWLLDRFRLARPSIAAGALILLAIVIVGLSLIP